LQQAACFDAVIILSPISEPIHSLVHPTLENSRVGDRLFPSSALRGETQKMTRASWGGKIIAESNATVVVKEPVFRPKRQERKPKPTVTLRSVLEGTAHYYHRSETAFAMTMPPVLPEPNLRR